MRERNIVLARGTREYRAAVLEDGSVRVDGHLFTLRANPDGSIQITGEPGRRAWSAALGDTRWVFLDGRVFEFEVQRRGRGQRRGGHHHGTLSAPMPATVRRIAVGAGDAVARGDTLIILEAMKMELPIRASANGIVEGVNCREGDLVQPGTPLIEIEENE
jgi:3-methylcrotonyl-CoA carboxylase alpha subunit